MFDIGIATNTPDDIECVSASLIRGANPIENHPVIGAHIRQAVLRGAQLVIVDPRRNKLAALVDTHLPVRIDSNVLLFNASATAIIKGGWVDYTLLFERIIGFDTFAARVAHYTPESVAERYGMSVPATRTVAGVYVKGQPVMCFHGLGVAEHLQDSEVVMALINLVLLTDDPGRPGGSTNPLHGQNNIQGAAQMGCDPATLTGAQSIGQADARFEQVWGAKSPATRGLDVVGMMDAAQADRLKALWVMGYDIYLSLANTLATAATPDALDLVIMQDLFINQTAATFGTVFLPAASAFEKRDTPMNPGRHVQCTHAVMTTPEQARSGWWIIQVLVACMGKPKGLESDGPEQIWNEVRALWLGGTGLAYSRLDGGSLH